MAKSSLIFLSIAVTAAGCSVLIDVDGKQCEVDADCVARGFESAVCSRNLCIVQAPPDTTSGGQGGIGGADSGSDDPLVCTIQPSDEATVKFSFAPLFAIPPEQPQPFSIKACLSLDPDCQSPIFGPIDVNAGEPQDFIVPRMFTGYFEISNPDTRTGLYFMGRALATDTVGWNVTVPNDQTITALALAAGEAVDPELGVIIAAARDCALQPLEGAMFDNSEGGLRFYFYQTTPDAKATKTGPQGAVGFANVPIGTSTLSVLTESGTELTPVLVRLKPRFVSFTEVFP